MEELEEIEEMNQTQPWLVNNIIFYEVETHTGNDREREQHFLQQRKTTTHEQRWDYPWAQSTFGECRENEKKRKVLRE